jgi:hypothetical protein
MPVVEPRLQQRREWHDGEPNEPPAVATPSAIERFSGGVCRLMEPKIGPNPAAAMPMPHNASAGEISAMR